MTPKTYDLITTLLHGPIYNPAKQTNAPEPEFYTDAELWDAHQENEMDTRRIEG